jgi:hypothetical protein
MIIIIVTAVETSNLTKKKLCLSFCGDWDEVTSITHTHARTHAQESLLQISTHGYSNSAKEASHLILGTCLRQGNHQNCWCRRSKVESPVVIIVAVEGYFQFHLLCDSNKKASQAVSGTVGRIVTWWEINQSGSVSHRHCSCASPILAFTACINTESTIWDITPCSPMKVNRHFGGRHCYHLQGGRTGRARYQRERRWLAFLRNVGWL